MPRSVSRITMTAGLVASLLFTGCGGGVSAPAASTGSPSDLTGSVQVFAASSLTSAFTELGEVFTAAHPDVTVDFVFAASSSLASQIADGAPADVFASADEATMDQLVAIGYTSSTPTVFATTRAQIIVEKGNPHRISGVGDLANEDLVVITCAIEAPCGQYARRILDAAGVRVRFRSFEENARAVVSKVVLGEADAGIVYETDVIAAGTTATGVAISDDVNIVARYPIALTSTAGSRPAARAFLDVVTSTQGKAVMSSFGFDTP